MPHSPVHRGFNTGMLAGLLAPPPARAVYCPRCRARVHRSHTQNRIERTIRAILGFRPYRCVACGWRGVRNPRLPNLWKPPSAVRTVVLIVFSAALGGVIVDKCIPQSPPEISD